MRRLLTLSVSVLLVLAACSPADEAASDSTSTTQAATETSQATTETTEAPEETTTSAAEATTTTAAAASGGPSCIEGQWIFSSESFVEVMNSMMTETELAEAEVSATDGTYLVTFNSDGTFIGERDEWGFSVSSPDGTFVISIDGDEEGTWTADESTITVSIASSDVNVSARVEADGQTIELPNSPVEVPEAIAEASAYQCDSDTLSVTTEEITFVLERA